MSRELFQPDELTADGPPPVRHGWTRDDGWLLPANAVGLGAAITALSAGVGGAMSLLGTVAFGAVLLSRVLQVATRQPALRVDSEGVWLGSPLPGRGRRVPWSDIAATYLWRSGRGPWRRQYLGLQHRDDQEVGMVQEARSVPVPDQVPRQVSYHAHRVYGWRLDRERFAAAVAHFAPEVEVVEVE